MKGLIHVLKRGEAGKVITFDLSTSAGAVDLTDYEVTMTLKRGSVIAINGEAVTKLDQVEQRGRCVYEWTDETADLEPGTYKGELKVEGGGNRFYFPGDEDERRAWFTVKVMPPLG